MSCAVITTSSTSNGHKDCFLVETAIAVCPNILYIKAPAAPFTVNAMPEAILRSLANHNEIGSILPAERRDCDEVLSEFAKAGLDIDSISTPLQSEGARSFVKSWDELISVIDSSSVVLERAAS
jgi:transaldolase